MPFFLMIIFLLKLIFLLYSCSELNYWLLFNVKSESHFSLRPLYERLYSFPLFDSPPDFFIFWVFPKNPKMFPLERFSKPAFTCATSSVPLLFPSFTSTSAPCVHYSSGAKSNHSFPLVCPDGASDLRNNSQFREKIPVQPRLI